MKTFGASAPLKELQQKFGFEPERIVGGGERAAGEKVARNSMSSTIENGQSSPLGATLCADAVNFSVFSKNATGMELLLFDNATDSKPRVVTLDPVKNRTYHYWHVSVPGLKPGQLYGY